jgi:hypothetical protein
MDVVTGWTGRAACALQAALRMSNEAFAEHLGIAVRTVAAWHQKPGLRPQPEMQQVLDAALARAPAAAGERFAVLTGEPARAVSARADDDGAAAATEHRLITDQNISRALSRLDQLAAWEPGTARRKGPDSRRGVDPAPGGTCRRGVRNPTWHRTTRYWTDAATPGRSCLSQPNAMGFRCLTGCG